MTRRGRIQLQRLFCWWSAAFRHCSMQGTHALSSDSSPWQQPVQAAAQQRRAATGAPSARTVTANCLLLHRRCAAGAANCCVLQGIRGMGAVSGPGGWRIASGRVAVGLGAQRTWGGPRAWPWPQRCSASPLPAW